MNTHPPGGLRLIVLIPHRDSRRLLRRWSAELFAAGLNGAWSFPWAAPLGVISRFLTRDELNGLAHALRESTLEDGRDGKMQAGAATVLPFPVIAVEAGIPAENPGRDSAAELAHLAFFGPALDLRLPEPLFAGSTALICGFPRHVLASAIVRRETIDRKSDDYRVGGGPCDVQSVLPSSLPPPPTISFRAAAVANMIYRPIQKGNLGLRPRREIPGGDGSSYSFEWEIREFHWLPSVKSKKKGE